MLSPWLIRNTVACGNPLFPFATGIFGTAHWSVEQAGIWGAGHASDGTLGERMHALWNQLLRFGLGVNPSEGEPWKPQWLILPWIAMIGVVIGIVQPRTRRWSLALLAMMFVQVAFWLMFTHLQSRFLLSAVVPMSLCAAVGISALLRATRSSLIRRALTMLIALGLIAWCSAPAAIFRNEARGAPAAAIGLARMFTGDDLAPLKQRELGLSTFPAVFVNHVVPASGRVLLVGEAAPLYYRPERITYNTVWDRGPLSRIMREQPDDPAAWASALREAGYTHVILNPCMLERWERSRWNDPSITAKGVMGFANTHLQLVQRYPRGEFLFEIPLAN